MSRRCSHCGHNGHNSRTCLDSKGGFKLFGVRLSADCCGSPAESSSSSLNAMRKSVSMGNLCNYGASEGGASPISPSHYEQHDPGDPVEGYASDDLVHTSSSSHERKKGVAWTEEEHRTFLLGLQRLGKGDWRGISRNFVKTRTPTQVASHAQKYFLRRTNVNKRRRRSSLFDITPDTVSSLVEEPVLEETGCDDPDVSAELTLGQNIPHGMSRQGIELTQFSRHAYPIAVFPVPVHQFALGGGPIGFPEIGMVSEAAKRKNLEAGELCENAEMSHLQRAPDVDVMEVVPEGNEGFLNHLAFQCPPMPMWPGQVLFRNSEHDLRGAESKIVRPMPIMPKPSAKVEDSAKFSELTINTTRPVMEPTPLSFKLLEEGSRHSAFHTTSSSTGKREVDGQGGLSNAISVP